MDNDIFYNDGTDWDNNFPNHNMDYFNEFIDTLIGTDDLVEPLEDDDEEL